MFFDKITAENIYIFGFEFNNLINYFLTKISPSEIFKPSVSNWIFGTR